MSKENEAVAVKFVTAMGNNDPVAAAESLAPEAFAEARGYSNFAGKRDAAMMIGGIEAFKSLMPNGLSFKILTVTSNDDTVVVEAEGNAVTCTGTHYRNHYCFVHKLKNGKIVELREYFCGAHANEVLWPLALQSSDLASTLG
jgi:ketosteroid isomerase-like protein